MNEKPASTKASSSLCEAASSAVQPNTLPPKAMGANSMPDLPSLRFSMVTLPPDYYSAAFGGAAAGVDGAGAGSAAGATGGAKAPGAMPIGNIGVANLMPSDGSCSYMRRIAMRWIMLGFLGRAVNLKRMN